MIRTRLTVTVVAGILMWLLSFVPNGPAFMFLVALVWLGILVALPKAYPYDR